jgi:hypothetical protein
LGSEVLRRDRNIQPVPYDIDPQPPIIDAELFTDGANLFVVTVESRDRDRMPRAAHRRAMTPHPDIGGPKELSFYYIGPTCDCSQLPKVEAAVNDAFKVSLRYAPFQSRRFQELRQEGRTPPPIPESKEIAATRALCDRLTCTLAMAIKSSGGLLVRDLPKQLPAESREQTEQVRKALEAHSLIDAEIVVVCTKTQAQVARAPSQDVLQREVDPDRATAGAAC